MLGKWERNVIPKWRRSTVAATLPENQSTTVRKLKSYKSAINLEKLNRELSSWKEDKSIGVAADLINFGHIKEILPLLKEPANFILHSKDDVPENLILMAKKILSEDLSPKELTVEIFSNPDDVFTEIGVLKRRLIANPRDAISLVDLARLYATLGQKEKANKAILIATSIYPDHRFILRSSIRHWIHTGEPEKGLYLLKKTERTTTDPWLLASELAVESVLKKSPKRWGLAKAILASERFNSEHISELASASASIYLADGNIKDAKKLFNKALVSPNDNSIAQAIWASQNFGIQIKTRNEWFEGSFSAEAKYYQKQSDLDFDGAIQAALEWFYSEPFSLRPLRAATYAASIIEKYSDAEAYARLGLKIDKLDIELRNNLVYALAGQGKLDEAVSQLQEVSNYERSLTGVTGYHTIANYALLHYRYGEIEKAEDLYRVSLKMLGGNEFQESKAIATVAMAKEAKLANAPNALELLAEAKKLAQDSGSKGAIKMLERLSNVSIDAPKIMTNQISSWLHDKASNTLLINKEIPFKVR